MRKATKIWLITAACLVIAGIACMSGALAAVGFDIHRLSTVKFVTDTAEISEKFDKIAVDITSADIEMKRSDSKKCRVEFYDREKTAHTAVVKDQTLIIGENDAGNWFDSFGLSFDSPKITIYLPKDRYTAVTIETVTGDVRIPKDFTFDELTVNATTADVECAANVTENCKISLTTGDISLSDIDTDAVEASVTTGDVSLRSVKAKESILIVSTTGDIRFDRCDAEEISISTTTGDVTGSLLSGKRFDVNSTTGDVRVPESSGRGSCKITTVTGDIRIETVK